MWRPELWENPYKKIFLKQTDAERLGEENIAFLQSWCRLAFEVGADAILGRLKGDSKCLCKADISEVVSKMLHDGLEKGYWVFVPEE